MVKAEPFSGTGMELGMYNIMVKDQRPSSREERFPFGE
jgi:hypothetical protein